MELFEEIVLGVLRDLTFLDRVFDFHELGTLTLFLCQLVQF